MAITTEEKSTCNDNKQLIELLPPDLVKLSKLSVKLENPLAGLSISELETEAMVFCAQNGLNEEVENFKRGAVLAGDPRNLDRITNISADERMYIEWEKINRWKQPMIMYYIAIISSMAAIVQGMDEAVVNGAQLFYYDRFGIRSDGTKKTALIQGLVNSAPYLCCAFFACWLTDPLNRWLGRRGVIFLSCAIAGLASIWEAFTYSWQQLFVSRLVLGLGIGPKLEEETQQGRNLIADMWRVARIRRAAVASGLLMFMQQFCGVNVIAYYSSQVFTEAGFTNKQALLTTMGTGLVNWVFAIPALYTIDTFGRRNLLLVTFPIMAFCLLLTGMAFFIPFTGEGDTRRAGLVASGIYLYMVFYSPGAGPVPFTYSAEAFPLFIRDFAMSYATAVAWLFNFILAITFPLLLDVFTPQGAFGWYAGWCIIGWVLVFFLMPETKALTLEELDNAIRLRKTLVLCEILI
ncbi:hypothetical protein CROQUDRAFT_134230 [Cronartium quercuum f. sp. fusiforme G11]|uniref:Major facilitator superfamily (MFS) profile domain-containing protein n=1 Tax=Cronartium quercuum f. sp. fusiforme G11 TaxID=708437 RepID=A0A9P6NFI6_9BASI|nr:hypothetical protein CROQUDRAFT_134230 [Cronartium quercuum f. sp. fusiforme G11]